jgi:hypothetical protein
MASIELGKEGAWVCHPCAEDRQHLLIPPKLKKYSNCKKEGGREGGNTGIIDLERDLNE